MLTKFGGCLEADDGRVVTPNFIKMIVKFGTNNIRLLLSLEKEQMHVAHRIKKEQYSFFHHFWKKLI
jgi:hypothetical protein